MANREKGEARGGEGGIGLVVKGLREGGTWEVLVSV